MAELIAHTPQHAVLETSGYIGEPTGTIEITENGTFNVKQYANADVNVPQPSGERVLTENNTTYNVAQYESAKVQIPEEEKTVTPTTSQQIVTPTNGLLRKVTVEGVTSSIDPDIQPENIKQDVSILGVQGTLKPPTLTTKQITENGTYAAEDDNADGYSEVEVAVSDPMVNQLLDGTCTELINHSVTFLKQYCFYRNDALQKIYCREVTTLGFGCFHGAHYLRVAFFPKLTSIDYNIFYGSGSSRPEGMQALILKKQVRLRDQSSFTQNTTNFYVPSAFMSWYSTATNWSVYYGDGRILTIEDNLEFLESFGFTEEELLSEE